MQYKLIGNSYNEIHGILKLLLDSDSPERSNKGPKPQLNGGQKHKIDNIKENNVVGSALTSPKCSIS